MANIDRPTTAFDVPGLKSVALSPMQLTGFLVHQLRVVFSNPDGILDPKLKGALWLPMDSGFQREDQASGIRISHFTDEQEIADGKLPGIFVRRSALKEEYQGVFGKNTIGQNNEEQGQIEVTRLYTGSYNYVVVCREYLAVERYLTELDDLLACLTHTNLKETSVQSFRVGEMGATERFPKGKDVWTGALSVNLTYLRKLSYSPMAPKLSKVVTVSGIE